MTRPTMHYDARYRATRNIKLLKDPGESEDHQGSSSGAALIMIHDLFFCSGRFRSFVSLARQTRLSMAWFEPPL